jgi:sterol desaturase/sphingolipid hydroxylase (fatty acid hydroxylase superfamily)
VAAVLLYCVTAIGVALAQVEAWSVLYVLVAPCAYVFANLVEYTVHRFLMHRVRWPLEFLYRRHSGEHHRFFTRHRMEVDSLRDLPAVIFPARVSLFFVGGVAAPAALVVGWRTTPDIGWLFMAAAVAYYLSYELLHLGAHLPEHSRWGGARVIRWVRSHHAVHHDPRRMRHEAFNITVPLWDGLLGTEASRDEPADSARDEAES